MKLPTHLITRLLPALMFVGSVAVTNQASATFATTWVTPNTQTVNVGDAFSVNLNWSLGGFGPTIGLSTPVYFDENVIQFVSASSTYSGATFNTSLSSSGQIDFLMNGGFAGTTLATFNFLAVGPGINSLIDINPLQIFTNQTYGINGTATDGRVTVVGSAPPPAEVPDASSTLVLIIGALGCFVGFRRRNKA